MSVEYSFARLPTDCKCVFNGCQFGAVRVKNRVVWHGRFDLFTKLKRYGALLANTEATTLLGEWNIPKV